MTDASRRTSLQAAESWSRRLPMTARTPSGTRRLQSRAGPLSSAKVSSWPSRRTTSVTNRGFPSAWRWIACTSSGAAGRPMIASTRLATSTSVSPRSGSLSKEPSRVSSARVSTSRSPRLSATSRYVPTTSRGVPSSSRATNSSMSSEPASAAWRLSRTMVMTCFAAARLRNDATESRRTKRASFGSRCAGGVPRPGSRSRNSGTISATVAAWRRSSGPSSRRSSRSAYARIACTHGQ